MTSGSPYLFLLVLLSCLLLQLFQFVVVMEVLHAGGKYDVVVAVSGLTVDGSVVADTEEGDDSDEDGDDDYEEGDVLRREWKTC